MSDETEEQKKLMRQIDISCVQAFHTMDEIDAMVELAKKYRLAAVFTLPAFSAHVAERGNVRRTKMARSIACDQVRLC